MNSFDFSGVEVLCPCWIFFENMLLPRVNSSWNGLSLVIEFWLAIVWMKNVIVKCVLAYTLSFGLSCIVSAFWGSKLSAWTSLKRLFQMVLIWCFVITYSISVPIKLSTPIQALSLRGICHWIIDSLILSSIFIKGFCIKSSSFFAIKSWTYLSWKVFLKFKSLFLFFYHLVYLVLFQILHQYLVLSIKLLVINLFVFI